jgi:hypothetical protein
MLDNAEFLYNNFSYLIIGVSPFYALYGFHLNIGHFINKEMLEREVLTAQERVKKMIEIRKTLLKQLLNASEYQLK